MSHAHLPPLVVGTLAIFGLAAYLVTVTPGPGPLAAAHASIQDGERMKGCVQCHADEGLAAGCLACHKEIAEQVREDKGYHAYLLRGKPPRCKECHADHLGRDFDITPAMGEFDHPHVAFTLAGKHEGLACEKCHHSPFGERARTFLGVTQECASCHENVHKEERFRDCAGCHTQEAFKGAAGFAHDKLPLVNGHGGVACGKCHENERDYTSVRGRRCEECHPSPHRVDWGRDCESCHARDATPWKAGFKAIDAALHIRTGFPLSAPHDRECAECHEGATFAVRFRDPPRPPSSCTACHEDVHKGQFAGKGCLECHTADRWKPSKIDHKSFPLRFAHAEVACDLCHKEGGFRGTPRTCAGCHEDRHKGQFGKTACDSCHDEKAFKPSRYDVARHETFALKGAHRTVACNACHAGGRFKETPRSCKACHEDPHGGQFAKQKECTACHAADSSTFRIRPFDHAKQAGYALEGAHAEAACDRCHVEKKGVRVFRGVSTECAACHTDVHRGQFKETSCDRCHTSREEWTAKGFDHGKTRFPLDRAHAAVACDRCHLTVRQPDGEGAVQYRPLPTECRSCHAFK